MLGLSARAALMWCDELVILDHASNDRSSVIFYELAKEYPYRCLIVRQDDPVWKEMTHRQAMLELARCESATHIVYIDADEVLTANLIPTIRQTIETTCAGGALMNLPWIALSGQGYIAGPSYWGDRQAAMIAFKDDPRYHWAAREGYDFHQRPPLGGPHRFLNPVPVSQGGLMHLQFLSRRRLKAKQCLYQLTEVLRWPGRTPVAQLAQMYGRAVYESDPTRVPTQPLPAEWIGAYRQWFDSGNASDDVVPWQETECKRLIAEHGRERFAGLDLFGVV